MLIRFLYKILKPPFDREKIGSMLVGHIKTCTNHGQQGYGIYSIYLILIEKLMPFGRVLCGH